MKIEDRGKFFITHLSTVGLIDTKPFIYLYFIFFKKSYHSFTRSLSTLEHFFRLIFLNFGRIPSSSSKLYNHFSFSMPSQTSLLLLKNNGILNLMNRKAVRTRSKKSLILRSVQESQDPFRVHHSM